MRIHIIHPHSSRSAVGSTHITSKYQLGVFVDEAGRLQQQEEGGRLQQQEEELGHKICHGPRGKGRHNNSTVVAQAIAYGIEGADAHGSIVLKSANDHV